MPSVERSQSLRNDSRPDSRNSLRPKVSFNRAVHIKRISRKDRLPQLNESGDLSEESYMAANGINTPSKFSTLPSRSARNGIKRSEKLSETVRPSERLSRLMVRQEPKPEDIQENNKGNESSSSGNNNGKSTGHKKKTFGERVRGIFGRKKKENGEDELRTRYTEFKGRNSSSDNETEVYNGKRRGSVPETKSSWFRSIERQKKIEVERGDDSTRRKYRYFGESDRESGRRKFAESSTESATEAEFSGLNRRTPSLVYLHTAAVGDIPQRRVETPTKRLSRSVSVLAPWAPRMRPPRSTRSRATQTDLIILEEEPIRKEETSKSLPKLVFTGPSFDTSGRRSTAASIPRHSSIHLRGRK